MNIDKFKLRIKCETTFQLLWLFNRVQFYTTIHLNYFSRQNLLCLRYGGIPVLDVPIQIHAFFVVCDATFLPYQISSRKTTYTIL